MIRKISAHYVFPVISAPLKFGVIICSDAGEILDVIDNKGVFKEISSLEFYDGILVPGFFLTEKQSNQQLLEQMKEMLIKEPTCSLEEIIRVLTLKASIEMNCEKQFGSFEKFKFPGVNLISPIDFNTMKLNADSKVRILIPQGKKTLKTGNTI